ncbi:MAG: hypothetical protein AAB639_02470 [Patescibacteria group bacterium]
MRDNHWLREQLQYLLKTYFTNVAITSPLEIRFGREAKFRFGSIRLVAPKGIKLSKLIKLIKTDKPQKSIITITSMFAAESVPANVVRYTIAHELCHYAHGFSSSNKRLFKYPHHGGIVNRELSERGAEELVQAFRKWLKIYRRKILTGRVEI